MLHDVDRYLVARRQAGLADSSLSRYEWHLRRLCAWLVERGVEDLQGVTRDLLRRWGAGLNDRWSPATVRQAVITARGFFLWCHNSEGILEVNPAEALVVPRVPETVQRTLTGDEVQALMGACDRLTVKGQRDYALVNVLVDTGLRAGEVCGIELATVNLDRHSLVAKIKGGAVKLAHFGRTTCDALREWIEVRVARAGVRTLFVSVGGGTPGRPLTTRGLRIVVKRLGEKAGVEDVSPHAFRRAFACLATGYGAPSRSVQLAGRWSNIGMVERYTAAMEAAGMYDQWSPADRLNGENGEHDDGLDDADVAALLRLLIRKLGV